jgi:UDP-3-O-[3-hydroxymyristoyl] glucosamine N-acyltransferase
VLARSMADPRFYDNRGPFMLADICTRTGIDLPGAVNGSALVFDVASLEGAGPAHLGYCVDKRVARTLKNSRAGFCLVPRGVEASEMPASMVALVCDNPARAFVAVAQLFYPESNLVAWSQLASIDPSASIGAEVILAPGVVVGPGAEIGDRTQIGPNSVVGPGVAIGRDCEIGSNVTVCNAYIGDHVFILSGAQIGQPGFGFVPGPGGHEKIPQLGRVIVQDKVEIGACSTIDRGALGDTVIGEGTKIDNLVQIGHNVHVGRHCVLAGQAGISGSSELGDFVIAGGQVGIADHAKIGDGARFAGRTGVMPGEVAGGRDYGGVPAKPIKDWLREITAVAALARRKRDGDE